MIALQPPSCCAEGCVTADVQDQTGVVEPADGSMTCQPPDDIRDCYGLDTLAMHTMRDALVMQGSAWQGCRNK